MSRRSAFLLYSNRRFLVQETGDAVSFLDDTPVIRLIESIWDHHSDQAFHLLRSRIYTNYPLTLRCQGAIQLAAKRVTVLSPEAFDRQLQVPAEPMPLDPPQSFDRAFVPPEKPESRGELARWIGQFPFTTCDRPILAALLTPEGQLFLAAPNASSSNRIRHAEVNLVRDYVRRYKKKIPRGHEIWVSLKPCRMCSGFIHELCEDGAQTPVTYLEDDPGPKARHSPLLIMRPYSDDQD